MDAIDLSEYVLEPLHENVERLLYCGRHATASDGLPRTLLVAAIRGHDATPTAVQRLQHEHALGADLDPRWTALPLALVRHRQRVTRTLAGLMSLWIKPAA